MQAFTNKFSIAVNQDKSEVIINFYQNIPNLPVDLDGSVGLREMQSTVIPVSNLVMSGQCAQNLVSTLSSLLMQSENQE